MCKIAKNTFCVKTAYKCVLICPFPPQKHGFTRKGEVEQWQLRTYKTLNKLLKQITSFKILHASFSRASWQPQVRFWKGLLVKPELKEDPLTLPKLILPNLTGTNRKIQNCLTPWAGMRIIKRVVLYYDVTVMIRRETRSSVTP